MQEEYKSPDQTEETETTEILQEAITNERIYLQGIHEGKADESIPYGKEASLLYSRAYHRTKEDSGSKAHREASAGYQRMQGAFKRFNVQFEDSSIAIPEE